MPQSLARSYIHLVFSAKLHERVLSDAVREPLQRYMAIVSNNHQSHTLLINSTEDHIHILFDLHRAVALSDAMNEIKTASSKWIKTQCPQFDSFAWQAGYGAFCVEARSVSATRDYIDNQQEHHRVETFQDEYRRLLTDNNLEFDQFTYGIRSPLQGLGD